MIKTRILFMLSQRISTKPFAKTLFLTLCSASLLFSCENVQTKPVKNNVLKEYINTPLEKTRDVKSRVESKQDEVRRQLLEDSE